MRFAPIAIVGSACVLPGALNPAALWDAVRDGRDLVTQAPPGRWRMPIERALCTPDAAQPDRTWSDRGGYVDGFDSIWNPHGFALPASELAGLDPLVHWLLHCAREAIRQTPRQPRHRVGAVFGNLGFPSEGMAAFADQVWRGGDGEDPRNRFMSGGSADILARALGLDAGSHALDAACASSLYAIKLACDRLQAGDADLMLAGAVQRADDLFLHIGFSALNALSRSGQSRPFHRDADGLLPAEGCALLALKRLADARRDGDVIHAIVRGIGLSNDGRGKGLLVPDAAGQQRAMRLAYACSGITPDQVTLLECHATGTPVGDATELRSSAEIFGKREDALPIGSLKSNLGHLITSAGAAGIIKLIEAMRAGIRPPTLHAELLTPALSDTPFRVLHAAEPWPAEAARIAAISAFGFGGNNAHLILSEDDADLPDIAATAASGTVVIVGIGCVIASANNRAQFSDALFSAHPLRNTEGEAAIESIELDLAGLRFPPRDLQQALPQQLAILHAAREALHECAPLPRDTTAVLIGMEPDAEIARYGTRWRDNAEKQVLLGQGPANLSSDSAAREPVIAPLESAGVIGCMPNIPANRLSAQFDLAGPAFTVQARAASGLHALHIACAGLVRGEIDAALIGAVDLCCEPVTRAAGIEHPADAAIAMVLKRSEDALRDGDRVYALLPVGIGQEFSSVIQTGATDAVGHANADQTSTDRIRADAVAGNLRDRIGNAGSADGLLQLMASALCLHHRREVDGRPWLSAIPRTVSLPLAGQASIRLQEAVDHPRRSEQSNPTLRIYSGVDKNAVIDALIDDRQSDEGPARLVLVVRPGAFEAVRTRALAHLRDGTPAGHAVHFRAAPIGGEIAFAFAGAGAAYADMGRDLVTQLPQLLNTLAERSTHLATALDWAFDPRITQPTALQQLWGASALSQLHAIFSEDILGLRADAWLGYSSGETNALVAAGVWTDPDALMEAMETSGLVTHHLGGEFLSVQTQWQRPVQWSSWTVLAPVDEVRTVLRDLEHVHLAIINGDADCLIAGDSSQCEIAVDRIGRNRCLQLVYPLAVHVPELKAMEAPWLELHRRCSSAPRHGRVYSNAFGSAYDTGEESCAQAILQQANQTLDLRPVILRAWEDGVRVFIEHGPGGTFGRAIRGILGAREALVVSLDRKGQGIEATLAAVAALIAAGVPMRHADLQLLLAAAPSMPSAQRPQRFDAHWPAVRIGAVDVETHDHSSKARVQIMSPAPRLPPAYAVVTMASKPRVAVDRMLATASVAAAPSPAETAVMAVNAVGVNIDTGVDERQSSLFAIQRAQNMRLTRVHRAFLQTQAEAQRQFLQLRERAQKLLFSVRDAQLQQSGMPVNDLAPPEPAAPVRAKVTSAAPSASPVEMFDLNTGIASNEGSGILAADDSDVAENILPSGPQFNRDQLLVHADGRIADIFGEEFDAQAPYARQVRMPRPPLLLADRVIGIAGEAGSMGRGRIWTETDVGSQDWYLHDGYMPAGVMIESGQADLMLISWLGVDAHNRGDRVYRLLGCELTYHGDLPRDGDTLRFDIAIDGHATQGDVRLMFFHYHCMNGDRDQLSVRKGQAGFFTDAELADSAGCLWTPESQPIETSPRLDAAEIACRHTALDRDQLQAFSIGDAFACFGSGFELARTHTRSPSIASGRGLLMDRVTDMDATGGPWQRGYLRAELDIDPQQWFFDGHFKNDPCMPGTLMFDGCLQAMAIHLAACGYTLKRDGWRFQPVPELPYQLQCRGQVTPSSRLLVTEVFVEERIGGPMPTVYADLLCTVDGLKAFHARRVALQLVPDWPMENTRNFHDEEVDLHRDRSIAVVDGFAFDRSSLVACALGRPSAAFGPVYSRFDGPMRVARLPSPPYLFISRIAEVHGPIGTMRAGARVVAEYDLPEQCWYLDENGCRRMPFAVLLEAALQPCGWLSSYVGSALTVDTELGFRNLDGEGTVLAELGGGDGILRTEVELTDVSASAGMIIENFNVRCWLGEREVYRLRTVFGFFPPAALAAQAGLPIRDEHRELLQRSNNTAFDLDAGGAPFFAQARLRLAGPMLRMIDRIEGIWPNGGAAGLGQLRAVKDVDVDEWFFKAHFFQDPVQPGSLGIEAMLQSLQAFLIHQNAAAGMRSPRFETIALDQTHQWKYRGQVLPHHHQVHTTLELTARGHDARGVYAIAKASLWVDGQRIYEANGLGVRIVEDAAR